MRQMVGREARKLYEGLAARGLRFFEAAETVETGEKSYMANVMLLQRLVRAGWVVKLQRDRYGLCRDGEELHPLAVGRELCGGSGYYVSHGSAMAVWGMAENNYPQSFAPDLSAFGMLRDPKGKETYPDGVLRDPRPQPAACFAIPKGKGEEENVVTISLTDGRRLRKRTVLGWEYRFVKDAEIEEKRLVGDKEKPGQWKVMEVEFGLGEKVWVSDPEWTILCGLGRPDLCGGVAAVARGLERWRERIDLQKLVRYAMQIRNRTAARRLGYILEELGMQTEETRLWLGLAVFEYYGRLEPGRPWAGELERKWRLDVNGKITTENTNGK